jgi:hypothetical protein
MKPVLPFYRQIVFSRANEAGIQGIDMQNNIMKHPYSTSKKDLAVCDDICNC